MASLRVGARIAAVACWFWVGGWLDNCESRGLAAPPMPAAVVRVIPGELSVAVFSHESSGVPGPCWSFLSRGLEARGQREIVVTVLRHKNESEEAVRKMVVALFGRIYHLAESGQLIQSGEWIELRSSSFLDPRFRGVAFVEAQRINGVDLPPGALAGLALDDAEVELAKASHAYRVLARLGRATATYPFPFWCDRDRASVAAGDSENTSLLGKVSRIGVRGVSLLLDNERHRVEMLVRRSTSVKLQATLARIPPNEAFALLGEPAREADGWLVWDPGQREHTAITPPGSRGSRLAGFHLLVAAGVGEDLVRAGEDGFAVLMRAESWARFKKALEAGGPFELPRGAGELGFQLRWIEPDLENHRKKD